jgi:transcriptional regulator with XRE-family HTH domain
VKTNKKPPFRRRRLGRKLRAMREAAGLTIEVAAARLELSRSSLFRLETGETRASVHVIKSMMDEYDIRDDDLLDAAREALKPSPYAKYGVTDTRYVEVEADAARVYEFAGLSLPGLLQTEAYMRAVFEHGHRRTPKQLENDVKVRSMRKQRLTSDDDPLELVAIIDEAALRREVGGPEVMCVQLAHLVEMAALPAVTLQVLPLASGLHNGMHGAFILLEFYEPLDGDLLYHAYVTGALHIEDEAELRKARLVFEALRREALNPAESVALIEQLAALRS